MNVNQEKGVLHERKMARPRASTKREVLGRRAEGKSPGEKSKGPAPPKQKKERALCLGIPLKGQTGGPVRVF